MIFTKLQFILNEGLIKTQPKEKVLQILKKFNPKPSDNSQFLIPLINSEQLPEILTLTNNLGYFPSSLRILEERGYLTHKKFKKEFIDFYLQDKTNKVFIVFEPKFDVEVIPNTNILYHITKKSYLEKILKFGLQPKNKEKISNHPERIYLLQDKESVKELLSLMDSFNDYRSVVLQITFPNIENFKFYVDVNSEKLNGIYTEKNIKPEWIQVLEGF